jgi:hypothetical protein
MRNIVSIGLACILMALIISSCNRRAEENYNSKWLGNSPNEIFPNIEEQLQGFSRAMTEVSYRYNELYWAGMDKNWPYAEYQREHIKEAMEQGFVRRPEHEESAAPFVNVSLPRMQKAIESEQSQEFSHALEEMIITCNVCHQMREVPFIKVVVPRERHTTVYFP